MVGAEAVREPVENLAIPGHVCEHERGRISALAVFVVTVEVIAGVNACARPISAIACAR